VVTSYPTTTNRLKGRLYDRWESERLNDALEAFKDSLFLGCSVTMLFKIAIMPKLDAVTPACAAIGSCNIVITRLGKGKISRDRIFIDVSCSHLSTSPN
jgi:shikimate 5-dehydrogenase